MSVSNFESFVKVREAARILGVSKPTAYRMTKNFRVFLPGSAIARIDMEALHKHLKEQLKPEEEAVTQAGA